MAVARKKAAAQPSKPAKSADRTKAAPPVRPRVIVTRRLPEAVETRMAELFDIDLNLSDEPMSRKALEAAVADATVLVPTVTDDIDAKLLAKAGPQLKLIANFGAGVDHIALGAAREKGIIVTNTPGVLTDDTADMAMALMLAVPRRLSEGERLVRAGQWQGWAPTGLLGHRQAPRHRRDHQRRIGQGRQLDHPGAIGIGVDEVGRPPGRRARFR